jgi:hypothetical protein
VVSPVTLSYKQKTLTPIHSTALYHTHFILFQTLHLDERENILVTLTARAHRTLRFGESKVACF